MAFWVLGFLWLMAGPWSDRAEAGLPKGASSPVSKDMVLIPEGEFPRGTTSLAIDWIVKKFHSESREWYFDETPAENIYLDRFFIDKYEVTNTDYRKFMTATGAATPKYWEDTHFNGPEKPVVGVTWKEAEAYCNWAGKRLPTEQEWEKAARGKEGRLYPWGNKVNPTRANVRGLDDGARYTSKVGQYPKGSSPYGVMDLAGNVWEWTRDWYQPYPGNEHANDMYGTVLKVIRGGSWNSNMDLARTAVRGKALPDQRQNYLGFRCVSQ